MSFPRGARSYSLGLLFGDGAWVQLERDGDIFQVVCNRSHLLLELFLCLLNSVQSSLKAAR